MAKKTATPKSEVKPGTLPRIDDAQHQRPIITAGGEALAFLALSSLRGVGQETLFSMAEAGQPFAEALEHGPYSRSVRSGTKGLPQGSGSGERWQQVREHALSQASGMMEKLQRIGVSILMRHHPAYPRQLLQLARPPQWLFVQGNVSLLELPSVAIVGTRKPSADGQFLTRYVGACLGDWRVPTVSGLALGIDQLAHEFSLRAQVPTIAVLGTGILENYPRGSEPLRHAILDAGGAIVSEYLPYASYSADNFVQRNRLQAGLGRVLIPTEWERRSGTAHTVRFASQLKRPIACLRLPDWPSNRVTLEPGLGLPSGRIFTVPAEQGDFQEFVSMALYDPAPRPFQQLSFFNEAE